MFQLFVIFHKYIFDECYKDIPQDILDKYITFIAVNEKIEKTYNREKYKVINEWELPIYNPTFQERGYNENSVLYHIYINGIHSQYSYVGFCQYDMYIPYNTIKDILNTIQTERVIYALELATFYFCCWGELKTFMYIIKDYSQFYKKKFDRTRMGPLLNTYIIPVDVYSESMSWVITLYDKLYPWCVQPPNRTHFGHLGGIYERVMHFVISQYDISTKKLEFTHDHTFKKASY